MRSIFVCLFLVCVAGFHLPLAPPLRSRHTRQQRSVSPVASIDQIPALLLARGKEDITPDDGFFTILQKLFVRDGVDAYYSFILVVAVGYFGFKAVTGLIESAKEQDIENAKAKADGRSELTDAFKRAARSQGYEKKRDMF